MSDAKVALGAKLFADPRLSVTGEHSCESCHSPARAFTDGLPRSRGATGETLPLNAPTLFNVAYNASLGWRDANVRTLEQQMRGPLFNEHPRELGLAGREPALERRAVGRCRRWRAASQRRFPASTRPSRMDNVIRAIAAYERTLFSGNSAFDRYVFAGDHARSAIGRKPACSCSSRSARAARRATAASISPASGWIASTRWRSPSFADTGTGVAVRVPDAAQSRRRPRPTCTTAASPRSMRCSITTRRLAGDPAADPRLRRAPLTTDERARLRAFLLSLTDGPLSPATACETGVCFARQHEPGHHLRPPHICCPIRSRSAARRRISCRNCRSPSRARAPTSSSSPTASSADLAALRLPEPRPAVRTDGLWRHSCFEAFIGHGGARDYWEYNFSPSGAWAAYHFTGYREGMAPLLKGAPPGHRLPHR